MPEISRRSALALGATAGVLPFASWATPAAARTYGPTEGQELAPGIRAVTLGNRDSTISAYKTVEVLDVVFQPGSKFPLGEVMEHDMVCTVPTGELNITQGDVEFTAKEGDVWSCAKASTREGATNAGSEVAVMRVIYLKA